MAHRQNPTEWYVGLEKPCSHGVEYEMWSRLVWWRCAEVAEKLAAALIMADGLVACRIDGADIGLNKRVRSQWQLRGMSG